ncbi:hypothetical protein CALCODRAFT_506172 [Calocera cornea HHB12733]|uniref:Uncharacterized protein n=1 Tax=Calocera cornea HHB12733 TaxID=1353952 RepID=A0A165JBD0_9BASI|nr:hypothetical protein CALCODRAFT_506172 [Calocera cornea HHB12733]
MHIFLSIRTTSSSSVRDIPKSQQGETLPSDLHVSGRRCLGMCAQRQMGHTTKGRSHVKYKYRESTRYSVVAEYMSVERTSLVLMLTRSGTGMGHGAWNLPTSKCIISRTLAVTRFGTKPHSASRTPYLMGQKGKTISSSHGKADPAASSSCNENKAATRQSTYRKRDRAAYAAMRPVQCGRPLLVQAELDAAHTAVMFLAERRPFLHDPVDPEASNPRVCLPEGR